MFLNAEKTALLNSLNLNALEMKTLRAQIIEFLSGLEFEAVVTANEICGNFRTLIIIDVENYGQYNQVKGWAPAINVQIDITTGEIL